MRLRVRSTSRCWWSTTTPSRSSTPSPSPGSSTSSSCCCPPVWNICMWWKTNIRLVAHTKYQHFLFLLQATIIAKDAFNGLESVEHLKLDFLNLNNTVAHTFRGLQASWQATKIDVFLPKKCFSELQKIVNRQLGPGDSATQSHSWHDQCGRAQGGQLKGDAEKIDFCKIPQKQTIWRSSGWQGARQPESGRHPITGGVIFQTVAVGFIFVNWKFLSKVLSVEGNHLLALPEDFDVQVGSRLPVVRFLNCHECQLGFQYP